MNQLKKLGRIQEHVFDALVIGAGGAGLKFYNGIGKRVLMLLAYLNYFQRVLIL